MSLDTTLEDEYLQSRSQLTRLVSRFVPRQDVEDIVQETYLRASQFGARKKIGHPPSLLRKVAKNLSLDFLKRAEHRLTDVFDEECPTGAMESEGAPSDPLKQAISDEEFSGFCLIVRDMAPQQRKVFLLRKVFGYSQKEIAEELGIAEGTVETHMARAMRHCVERSMGRGKLRRIEGKGQREVAG